MIEQFAREGGKEFRQCTMFDASWRSQQLLQRFLRFTPVVGKTHARTHARTHTHTHSHTHTLSHTHKLHACSGQHTRLPRLVYGCVCICRHTMHAYMHTSILTCMHACIHTCMHTCLHTDRPNYIHTQVGNSPDFLAILRLLTEMISNVVNVSQVSNRGVSPVSAICGDTSVAGRGLLANMWRHLCCRSGSFSWTARRWTCGCCTRSVSSPPRCMYLY